MTKRKYIFPPFRSGTMKKLLATYSENVIEKVDSIYTFLSAYTKESYGQSPMWCLHNMMQNHESIFGLIASDIVSSPSMSGQGETGQKTSSPLKGDSSSSHHTQRLLIEVATTEALVSESLETKTTTHSQVSDKLCKKSKILSILSEVDKMDVSTVHDVEIKNNPEEHNSTSESNDEIKDLIERNLVQINEVEVFRIHDIVGVEIDIGLSCTFEDSSPKKRGQDSSSVKKTNCPEKPERNSKLQPSSRSKSIKFTACLSIVKEPLPGVNYSDTIILDYLAKRLLLILSFSKRCIDHIHKNFQRFLEDVQVFYNGIYDMKFVLDYMKDQPYDTVDLQKLRSELINILNQIMPKVALFIKDVEKDLKVFKRCLDEIEANETAPALSTKVESNRSFSNLQKIALRLNDVCKDVYDMVITNDGRKVILSNSSSDFKWLVNHFVKILIITGLLTFLCPSYPGLRR